MEHAFVIVAVVALTELAKRLKAGDWVAAVTIVGAAIIGALAGFFHVEGLDVVSGIVAGLGAAGSVTLAGRFSGLPSTTITTQPGADTTVATTESGSGVI